MNDSEASSSPSASPSEPAAVWLSEACWVLVSEDTAAKLPTLTLPTQSATDHFSADLILRFLPSVYRRALARADRTALADDIETVLRRWPLSGVLADLEGEPTGDTAFDGHAGLQLLYAERLVKSARPGWLPKDGRAREWLERIFSERGRALPCPPVRTGDDLAVLQPLKGRFVGRDEVLDLIALAAIAGEHLFLCR